MSTIGVVEEPARAGLARLTVNCASNSTTLTVRIDRLRFVGDHVDVEYRIDQGPIRSATWDVCAQSDCAGLWRGAGIPLARSFFDRKDLRLVIRSRYSPTFVGTFWIEGAREAMAPLARACQWPG